MIILYSFMYMKSVTVFSVRLGAAQLIITVPLTKTPPVSFSVNFEPPHFFPCIGNLF